MPILLPPHRTLTGASYPGQQLQPSCGNGTKSLADTQSHGTAGARWPGAWVSGRLESQVFVGHSLAAKSVFYYLCLIQRAGGHSEECVCVWNVHVCMSVYE